MPQTANSKRLVRTSVASLVCASAAVVTAALLAGREDRSPALVAANGGFAVAAAIFATISVEATLRSRDRMPSQPLRAASDAAFSLEALRTALDRIARIAQAGTIGDSSAAEHAFAMIARHAGECSSLLNQI